MHTIRICRHCNSPIPSESAGSNCPECGSNFDSPGFTETGDEPLVAPTPAELAPLFPGLEIMEVAGQGGMGTIYKARQPQLDRVVALKILSPELGRDPAFADRFSREAQALAKLNHSNIVNVFDFGQVNGLYYFLMEYVDGVTLRTLIAQKQVRAEEALRIVIEICHALQYAHDEGIVHRDVKPSNILLDKKGRVKIADFGLASLMGKRPKNGTDGNRPAMIMGTPTYMAPEQLERPGKVDQRADVYALGVLLYEMLTGEVPVGQFEPPSVKTGLDPRLDEIVLRALAKSPRRRYQNANQFRAAVEDATGFFHNLPGDLQRGARRRKKWGWLPRFALAAGSIWLVVVTCLLFKDRLSEEKSVLIPAGALEAFAAGPEGVGIGRRFVTQLNLSTEQVQTVNRLLRREEEAFRELELRHTERSKNAAGHVVVTIQPFPQDMDTLINRLWAELAKILNPTQIANAKNMHFERFFPHTGKKPVVVEIWQDENGEYHYIEGRPSSGKGAGVSSLLPRRYQDLFSHDNQGTNN